MRISDWSSDVCSSDLRVAGESAWGDFLILLNQYLAHGQPLYMALYGGGIIFFCFFYVAVVFNPEETADNLKRQNGFIPGIRPGKNTAAYLDFVLTRITVIGAAYLALIRSEEHTSELQSLMRISYAVFCLKKKNKTK